MAKKAKVDRAEVVPSLITPADVAIAYKQVFSTQEGQIVLADLMRLFGFCRHSTFAPGDPYKTSFNEGSRRVLMHIGIQFDIDPAQLESNQESTL